LLYNGPLLGGFITGLTLVFTSTIRRTNGQTNGQTREQCLDCRLHGGGTIRSLQHSSRIDAGLQVASTRERIL